jgi:hypothetical protein|tara:strand:+ start:74 stop:454 length:381 start_codon:yes stop_codon:yes gene_type:complete
MKGKIKFKFGELIKEYNKNETIADMYYDVFEGYEQEEINISKETDETDMFNLIQKICTDKEGKVFDTIKYIYRECQDYFIEDLNLGGESIVGSGKIIFTDEKNSKEHVFSIFNLYEDFDDDEFLYD